jgi:hypothetical protein
MLKPHALSTLCASLTLSLTLCLPAHALNWDADLRVRLSGPFMGTQSNGLNTVLGGGVELSIGPLLAGGGYAISGLPEGIIASPFFYAGAALTFRDDRKLDTGSWQARLSGLIGYDRTITTCGSDCIGTWHALAITAAIDGTWWFSRVVGLELRLSAGATTALARHDGPTFNDKAPSPAFSVLTSIGFAFDL